MLIAYCSPFVPVEWIAAHRLRPVWLRPRKVVGESGADARRGVCPVAGALFETLLHDTPGDAVVLTTTCDQMRYAAVRLECEEAMPIFLMHVPRTWGSESREYYASELRRLSDFLVERGGQSPTIDHLAGTMLEFDRARVTLLKSRENMSAADFSNVLLKIREHAEAVGKIPEEAATKANASGDGKKQIPLGLIGGPMLPGDWEALRKIEKEGGRIVFDGTETGERTLPDAFNPSATKNDPFAELVRAYFDTIVDIFRRPNDALFAWLRDRIISTGARGLLFRRQTGCDLWRAELPRLREAAGVPLIEWDSTDDPASSQWHSASRLDAFWEILK